MIKDGGRSKIMAERTRMSQCETIIKAMLDNPNKEWWSASDFQKAPYFVGYEASARMSDIMRLYPSLVEVGRDGRFRTLKIRWENVEENGWHCSK